MKLGDLFININKGSIFYEDIYKLVTKEEYLEVNAGTEHAEHLEDKTKGGIGSECQYVLMMSNEKGDSLPGGRWDSYTSLEDATMMEKVYKMRGFLERYKGAKL